MPRTVHQQEREPVKKRIIAVTAAAAAIGLSLAAASSAAATTTNYKVITISGMHPDTTSVSGTATQTDPSRGPVWAVDHLKETLTATHQANGTWNVTIAFAGSTFAGFADPRTTAEGSSDPGGPLLSQGKITGSIHYNGITSATPPDPAGVAAHQPANTSLSAVVSEYFDGQSMTALAPASTPYLISYTPNAPSQDVVNGTDTWAAGATYTQSG
jgi:hypothetical protein